MATGTVLGHPENSTIVRTTETGYPRELVRLTRLRDGAHVRLRPIRPDDEPRLVDLFHRLSVRTVYERFHTPFHRLPAAWYHHFANVDYHDRLALVAEDAFEPAPALRAVARWEPGEAPATAEIALVVEDAWQDRGLGTRLLDALLEAGEARGIRRFAADVLAENRRMLRVLSRVADIRRRELDRGVLTVEFERRPAAETALP